MAMYGAEQLIKYLDEAVLDYGKDWVDPNATIGGNVCQYIYYTDEDGQCWSGEWAGEGIERNCIVGHVLLSLYPEKKDDILMNNTEGAESLLIELGLVEDFDQEAQKVLDAAQSFQDNGHAWGDVVEAIKQVVLNPPDGVDLWGDDDGYCLRQEANRVMMKKSK